MKSSPRLERIVFRTSRLLDFVGQRELTAQIGHAVPEWPLVVLKELVDNTIDACEEAGVAPVIVVEVSTVTGGAAITISDNGPGIAADTVVGILDYSVRVSSREAYVSPTRGAQGNALKTVVAMPYALDGDRGTVEIVSRGVAHEIVFAVDRIRQEPRIRHTPTAASVKNGTSITVSWPDSAKAAAKGRFLQICDDYAWLNPHLAISVRWDGETVVDSAPSQPDWRKWKPSDPTSAHWYDAARFERYLAAHLARAQDIGRDPPLRAVVAEFRGLSSSVKQKAVAEESGTARLSLAEFLGHGETIDHAGITRLLAAMQHHSRPAGTADLGTIGRDHLLARFTACGVQSETFKYKRVAGIGENGVPVVIETAFGWCPDAEPVRRIVAGVNWSVALGNPFRSFGRDSEGLEAVLNQQRAGRAEPIVVVAHLASPRVEFSDRGKTALVL